MKDVRLVLLSPALDRSRLSTGKTAITDHRSRGRVLDAGGRIDRQSLEKIEDLRVVDAKIFGNKKADEMEMKERKRPVRASFVLEGGQSS